MVAGASRRLLQLWVGGILASAFVTGMASLAIHPSR